MNTVDSLYLRSMSSKQLVTLSLQEQLAHVVMRHVYHCPACQHYALHGRCHAVMKHLITDELLKCLRCEDHLLSLLAIKQETDRALRRFQRAFVDIQVQCPGQEKKQFSTLEELEKWIVSDWRVSLPWELIIRGRESSTLDEGHIPLADYVLWRDRPYTPPCFCDELSPEERVTAHIDACPFCQYARERGQVESILTHIQECWPRDSQDQVNRQTVRGAAAIWSHKHQYCVLEGARFYSLLDLHGIARCLRSVASDQWAITLKRLDGRAAARSFSTCESFLHWCACPGLLPRHTHKQRQAIVLDHFLHLDLGKGQPVFRFQFLAACLLDLQELAQPLSWQYEDLCQEHKLDESFWKSEQHQAWKGTLDWVSGQQVALWRELLSAARCFYERGQLSVKLYELIQQLDLSASGTELSLPAV
jgi:hypothetical protein